MTQKKYDITVFGCASSVYVLKVKQLPQVGKSVWIENANVEPFNGGVGYNICANLASLGAKVYPVLSYPDERLDALLHKEFCPKYNWPTDGLFGPPQGSYRMCYMFQDEEKKHMTIMYRYGEHVMEEAAEGNGNDILDKYVDESKMVILASPRPANTERILRLLLSKNIAFVFSYRNDPMIFPEPILKEILLNATILFMNDMEAEEVKRKLDLKSIDQLFGKGKAKIIVTTMGKEGCVVYSRQTDGTAESFRMPITKNELGVVDTVGAGDAFLSGFMYGYLNNKSLQLCAQYGNTMSSFIIEKEGSTTNIPSLEQMLERNATRPDALNM